MHFRLVKKREKERKLEYRQVEVRVEVKHISRDYYQTPPPPNNNNDAHPRHEATPCYDTDLG